MSPREQVSRTIRTAAGRGQPALVAYLTAGFPSRERFRDHLRALADAADVVEVGVPFTDPMADGVTICTSASSCSASAALRSLLSSRGRSGTMKPDTPARAAHSASRATPKESKGFR